MCLYVCLSVCLSVFYLLDHWRDRNETFRGCRHQPLNGYYVLETYCCYVNFKVICEKKTVSRLMLVAHIHIYPAQETTPLLPPTSYIPFYLLPPCLPPISLSTSYLPFYLLPSFLSPTSDLPFYLLPISYLPFYLLPLCLSPASLSISYLPFYLLTISYLLPLFLPPTSHLPPTSSLLFYLLPPFLPLLSTSHRRSKSQ